MPIFRTVPCNSLTDGHLWQQLLQLIQLLTKAWFASCFNLPKDAKSMRHLSHLTRLHCGFVVKFDKLDNIVAKRTRNEKKKN